MDARFLLLVVAACGAPPRAPASSAVTVYFPLEGDPFMDCAAHGSTRRALASSDPETVLDVLLRGPTKAERRNGLGSPFERSVAERSAPPLRGHAHVTVSSGVAIVDFDTDGSHYLYQAICARTAVTSSIQKTLVGLGGIREVRFAIRGEVVTEWDA
jgi:hypothetical protein